MTYSERFENTLRKTLKHEGKDAAHPGDPGGLTRFGISSRSFPTLDIRSLTLDDAKAIYHKQFWLPYPYERMASATVAAKTFDIAVNTGAMTAHRLLQRAIRAAGTPIIEDGVFGPHTLTASAQAGERELLAALKAESAGYYRSICAARPELKCFLRGWLRRAYDDTIN